MIIINVINLYTNNNYIYKKYKELDDGINIKVNYTNDISMVKPYSDIDIIIGKHVQGDKIPTDYIDRKTIFCDISDTSIHYSKNMLNNKWVVEYNKFSIIKKEYIEKINDLVFFKYQENNNNDENEKYNNQIKLILTNFNGEEEEILKDTYHIGGQETIFDDNYKKTITDNYYKLKNPYNFGNYRRLYDEIKQEMIGLIDGGLSTTDERTTDINFIGTRTLSKHREDLMEILNMIDNVYAKLLNTVDEKMNFWEFFAILTDSKITISPWGFGEYCYRDYEALMSKSILIKPETDFSYVDFNPFIPNKTIFYVKPEWSNLREVIDYALKNVNQQDLDEAYEKQFNNIGTLKNNILSQIKRIYMMI